jgi:hypothetical protein
MNPKLKAKSLFQKFEERTENLAAKRRRRESSSSDEDNNSGVDTSELDFDEEKTHKMNFLILAGVSEFMMLSDKFKAKTVSLKLVYIYGFGSD